MNLAKNFAAVYSVLDESHSHVFVIALKESDTYVSKSRIFLYANVKGILQSIQNGRYHAKTDSKIGHRNTDFPQNKGHAKNPSKSNKNVEMLLDPMTSELGTNQTAPIKSDNQKSHSDGYIFNAQKLFEEKDTIKGCKITRTSKKETHHYNTNPDQVLYTFKNKSTTTAEV